MTIHRAKGLEFPVVCVADLGRAVRRPPRAAARRRRPHRRSAPRAARRRRHDPHAPPGSASRRPRRRGRRRGGAAALLRRHDPRPRAADPVRRHGHDQVAGAAQRRPADRLDRPRASTAERCSSRTIARAPLGGPARAPRVTKVNTPETLPEEALQTRARAQQHSQPTALPSVAGQGHAELRPRPARRPQRLSLQPALRLRQVRLPLLPQARARPAGRRAAAAREQRGAVHRDRPA